jgi:hypothetical protein
MSLPIDNHAIKNSEAKRAKLAATLHKQHAAAHKNWGKISSPSAQSKVAPTSKIDNILFPGLGK